MSFAKTNSDTSERRGLDPSRSRSSVATLINVADSTRLSKWLIPYVVEDKLRAYIVTGSRPSSPFAGAWIETTRSVMGVAEKMGREPFLLGTHG